MKNHNIGSRRRSITERGIVGAVRGCFSTHDYDLANQAGAAFRADANLVLAAILSLNSSATAPATTVAGMLWYDTANGVVKQRNSTNAGWVTRWTVNTTDGSFAALTSTGAITEANRCGAYQWAGWNPTDVAGTLTDAGSAATLSQAATSYMTIANASGTVTFTFTKAGTYLITARTTTLPAAAVDAGSYNRLDFGGTATRLLSETTVAHAMNPAADNYGGNVECSFLVIATANQTLTILPKVALVRAAGTASNYPTYAEATATYVGG